MLNLKHLYYFYIFSQELSTSRAASRLSISSPALSTQLKLLDDYLGFSLCRRVNGKFALTANGEVVLGYAQKMFSTYESLVAMLAGSPSIRSDCFHIGIGKNVGPRFALDIMSLTHQSKIIQAPTVCISYESAESLLMGFKEEKYDLILGSFSRELAESSVWSSQGFQFPVRFFAPESHFGDAFAEQKHVEPEEIIQWANKKNVALVLPEPSSVLRRETDQLLAKIETKPLKTIECNSATGIVQLIERGLAVGFAPASCLLDFKIAKRLVVVGGCDGYWNHAISFVTQKVESAFSPQHLGLKEVIF